MSKRLDGKKQLEEMLNQPLPVSDTPRTDADTWRDEMDHVDTDYTFAQSVTVSADFARQLERELADMTKQRDALAEALREIASGAYSWKTCVDVIAPKALAAKKGGSHE
jgi:glycosyltransferase involved in cell wall biosynthesis